MKSFKYYGVNLTLMAVTFITTSLVIGSIAFYLGQYAGSNGKLREIKDMQVGVIQKILSENNVTNAEVSNSSGPYIHVYGKVLDEETLAKIKKSIEVQLGKASPSEISYMFDTAK